MLAPHGEVWVWPHNRPMNHNRLVEEVVTATGLYCMLTDTITAAVVAAAPKLRVISQMAVGVDNIDLEACLARRIPVGHTPDVLTETTADTAFGLLIAGARRFREGLADVTLGRWGDWDPDYLVGHDISGSTLGIIGFGRIGQAVARRAGGFDMRILYTQRRRNPASEVATGAVYADLLSLLADSDHVVVATPLNESTRHLIGHQELEMLRPTATLINISRGPVVDTDALVEALRSGSIAAAALDVTDPEPLPADHPLASMSNCFILPHLGSASVRTRQAMAELAARNLVAGLAGRPLEAAVSDPLRGAKP
ncbi:MAG: D-glycerate dehydrogenase [Acidimicrobiia bacterium]|nr:D-glycerate dehydrogenase [Acidimicrobiia bacterium]